MRISPGGFGKNGAIDNAKPVNTENLVLSVNDLSDMATAVVVPNSDDGVFAKLLQGYRVVGVPRHQVDIGLGTHVEHLLHRGLVALRVVDKVLRLRDFDGHSYALDAAAEIVRMAEVVEGDGRVFIDVGGEQADVAC